VGCPRPTPAGNSARLGIKRPLRPFNWVPRQCETPGPHPISRYERPLAERRPLAGAQHRAAGVLLLRLVARPER
ncbi:MAG: hypothetical protein WAK18_09815, partial [Nocardioidaceae bacterium]